MVERVVSQTELDTPDPSLIQQMRRLELSHFTGHLTFTQNIVMPDYIHQHMLP